MGEDLYREFEGVREIFDMAEEISRIHVTRLCFKGPMEELTQTVNLQPAVTAVNLACLAVLERENIACTVCAGHSLGEYSALAAAGALSREDTLRLVDRRGRLMDREAQKQKGAMQALVGLDIKAVEALVEEGRAHGTVAVANHNMETQIVITGAPEPVAKVAAAAAAKGAKAVPLKVSGAWHSELMRGAEAEFREALSRVEFKAPGRPLVFNVTAQTCSDPDEIRDIMSRQLCSPVRWYDSMGRMREGGVEIYVEIGPGKVLSGLMRKILPKDDPAQIMNVGSLAQLEAFLKAAA
jgi:[acyl-carrier-protein] S-malonyltransferase